ncbi:MAG: hypothetical protein KF689_12465 [Gemmatimonadaceae bacterium]|nr:hypothetical protein [Gemmatimonadaceae bacterium]MCW5827205.1 hypothetical protein [Gemmatimonadaceae bacterium]
MAFTTTKLLRAAEAQVRERLRQRPMIPLVESVVGSAGLEDESAVSSLAAELAKVIGVEVGHLRPTETLRESLRVHRNELGSEIGKLMTKVGLDDVVDPFAFGLLDLVERKFREKPTRVESVFFAPAPKNEDEWVERILDLTVADFLRALA